jgi:hypothetical protein
MALPFMLPPTNAPLIGALLARTEIAFAASGHLHLCSN